MVTVPATGSDGKALMYVLVGVGATGRRFSKCPSGWWRRYVSLVPFFAGQVAEGGDGDGRVE